ncbi:hypothetical protein ACQKWADRAFT_315726 [Trichoderma austrokoningii]
MRYSILLAIVPLATATTPMKVRNTGSWEETINACMATRSDCIYESKTNDAVIDCLNTYVTCLDNSNVNSPWPIR